VKSEDQVEKAFDRWRRKLGLDHFSAHVMRHSYGTAIAYLRKADGSYAFGLLQAMAMMDHKDPKETAIYFHARGDDVREALGALQHDEQSQLHHPPDAESTSSS
jgi:integrase